MFSSGETVTKLVHRLIFVMYRVVLAAKSWLCVLVPVLLATTVSSVVMNKGHYGKQLGGNYGRVLHGLQPEEAIRVSFWSKERFCSWYIYASPDCFHSVMPVPVHPPSLQYDLRAILVMFLLANPAVSFHSSFCLFFFFFFFYMNISWAPCLKMSPKHFTMATRALFSAYKQTHCTVVICILLSDCSFTYTHESGCCAV